MHPTFCLCISAAPDSRCIRIGDYLHGTVQLREIAYLFIRTYTALNLQDPPFARLQLRYENRHPSTAIGLLSIKFAQALERQRRSQSHKPRGRDNPAAMSSATSVLPHLCAARPQ
ncbi:hypothetical protein EJ04DRAFT_510166 [Polyplosphaeria fusca]|uniref:Uncharacterized protein n=1 Tax=Polyplosphaeria fusca TaxID=682080 RepID=A0A9P4R5S6_9PLEO|nr:hypothetical protein EJ04DRAFT_510166 [Polyplosphaeria fusca]